MGGKMTLEVSMTLQTDAIFGSGYSAAGGADIVVRKDAGGWPFLPGSAWKGLLRESLENLLVWTGGQEETLSALMGERGWNGREDGRRLTLTSLTLSSPHPASPDACFWTRTFTSLNPDTGTAAARSLRSAECVRRGLVFTGEISCGAADRALVEEALLGIRFVGTMRSRGFGEVCWRVQEKKPRREDSREHSQAQGDGTTALRPGRCLRYRLRLHTPALITDLSGSQDSHYETRGYLPGSAIRGLVIGALAAEHPHWFAAHRTALLSQAVQFLDALPLWGEQVPIPAIRSFYESKDHTVFKSVLNEDISGLKRAKTGEFCAIEQESGGSCLLRFWKARTGGAARIAQSRRTGGESVSLPGETDQIFETRYLLPDQEFEGYILLRDPAMAEMVGGAVPASGFLGADRFAGYGQFTCTCVENADAPRWMDAYGYREGEQPGKTLYLLAVSPLAMRDSGGVLRGFDKETGEPGAEAGSPLSQLAEKLGVGWLKVEACDTSLAEYGGYNRTWGCRLPAARMYDRGSVFKLLCGSAPSLDALRAVQAEGLGIRREEGFGQVLFLRSSYFDPQTGIRRAEKAGGIEERPGAQPAAAIRRRMYGYVMENVDQVVQSALSTSQIGTLQALCEKARRTNGDDQEIFSWFDRNEDKNVRHSSRFPAIRQLVEEVLHTPLSQTLQTVSMDPPWCPALEEACPKGQEEKMERLRLLCLLFNYSRREKRERPLPAGGNGRTAGARQADNPLEEERAGREEGGRT